MVSKQQQQQPTNPNEQIDEKGLLQPESNNHTLYVMPLGAAAKEQHALQTLFRLNDQLEQSSPPSESRAARITALPSALNSLHASQVAAWSTSQLAENKQSVLFHASLPCATLQIYASSQKRHHRTAVAERKN